MRGSLAPAVLAAVLAASGCALRRPSAPPAAGEQLLRIGAVRSGDGFALTWDSVPGREYTVLYTENLVKPDWKPLKGCRNLRGRGGRMEARDDTPGAGMRYYRLHVGRYP
ncbi:MAG: hypothetical protein JXB04_09210 [Kiritimatiellae bacterium]|nr:hypothetical protein [Kiritimatiellia bacterium]